MKNEMQGSLRQVSRRARTALAATGPEYAWSCVIWKQARDDQPPVRCFRRVADSEEAARVMVELRAGTLDPECFTAAEQCTCRAALKQGNPPAVAAPETDAISRAWLQAIKTTESRKKTSKKNWLCATWAESVFRRQEKAMGRSGAR